MSFARAGRPGAAPVELAKTQRLLRALVTAPNGVAAALRGDAGVPGWLTPWPDPSACLADVVSGDAQLSAPARLDVYANAYFQRLLEVLVDDYPTLSWLMGEAAFNDVATAYLVAHPSRAPSLRELGGSLGDFLEGHAAADFVRPRWPFASDLARLEWAFVEAFDAPDVPLLDHAMLEARPPEQWADLPLASVPSVSRCRNAWRVADIVRAHRAGVSPPGNVALGAENLAVWRERERAVFIEIDETEAAALEHAERGGCFGDLCEWAADRAASDEVGAADAARWLAGWVARGWLTAS